MRLASSGTEGSKAKPHTTRMSKPIATLAADAGAQIPVNWQMTTLTDGGVTDFVKAHDAAWADGVEVWPQVSCRPLTFQMNLIEPFTLNMNPQFAALMTEGLDARRAAHTICQPPGHGVREHDLTVQTDRDIGRGAAIHDRFEQARLVDLADVNAAVVDRLYERTIDFGGHPNVAAMAGAL